ncbi:hypothetical protein [Borrelia sp. RT1S]|uniref:hypothetical protein n=1 Tax=Borrelia sp. RT1S TaxID=2898580 RepID=UPI001E2E1470|nr:hypothetical protein [Borrelia sp. RT1S]UGQ17509.1 hypothetical protein LSO05_03815 [Borrelia sp. RT1S]
MHIRVIGILILMLLIGSCKWWSKAETGGRDVAEVVQDDPEVVAERAAEEVSRVTGKSAAEVKSLSKKDLDKFAEDAMSSAEATAKSVESGRSKKKSELIDEIKGSADKLDLAFKAVVGAGHRSGVVNPVIGNMKILFKRLELADKLAIMLKNGSNNTIGEVRKEVEAVGAIDFCMSAIKEEQGSNKETKVTEDRLKECFNNIVGSIGNLLGNGVQKPLQPAIEGAPEKFKDALRNLWTAALMLRRALINVKA